MSSTELGRGSRQGLMSSVNKTVTRGGWRKERAWKIEKQVYHLQLYCPIPHSPFFGIFLVFIAFNF